MVPITGTSSSSNDGEDGTEDFTTNFTHQQLKALQSLIPNSTKTDTRSILEETRDYLQRIHEETEKIEKDLLNRSLQGSNTSSHESGAKILKVEVEKLTGRRFVVKISWRGGVGAAGQVQRVIECLDVKMTSIVVKESDAQEMITTAFIKVQNEMRMSEEEIQDFVMNATSKFRLLL